MVPAVEAYTEAFRLATPFGPCVGITLPTHGRFNTSQASQLDPAEVACAEAFSDLRARTFAGGRLALREAFRLAALPAPGPLLWGSGGEPLLPAGVWGSVTHKEHLAVAIACPGGDDGALGIDLETTQPGSVDIARRILRPEEAAGMAHLFHTDRSHRVRLVFSAKEAIYKAGFPLCKRFFGFQDARLSVPDILVTGTFNPIVADLTPEHWKANFRVKVLQTTVYGHILSLALALKNTENA